MNIYKSGENRKQQSFFPASIDEYVSEDNQVRAIEDYVELLDMVELGFTKSALNSSDGQPAYHPKLLLKIYIYGYLNKIRSSRKLEQEIGRNIEMMWLCAGLKPKYKTIANFRKENSKALKKVFREFVLLCKELELITGEFVAVDGAFLRANASKNQLIMKKSVERDLKKIDEKIEAYLETLEFSDTQEKKERALKPLPTKSIPKITKRKAKLDKDLALLEEMGVTQYNRTDPDAKVMVKPAHNLMAYNVQIAVDSKFKFIIATDISSVGQDSNQLCNMGIKSKEITQNEEIKILADKGYYNAKEIKESLDNNITPYIPTPKKNDPQAKTGLYTQDKFSYDEKEDCYLCPNNQKLEKAIFTQKKRGRVNLVYRGTSAMCKICPLRDNCLPKKTATKSIYKWEHQNILEEHHKKMETDEAKKLIKRRGSIVEHPFGTIKQHLGWSHFLVRGKEKVSGENALIMFSYNFRRLLNLIGIALFRKLMIAIKDGNIEDIKVEIVAYIVMILYISLYFFATIGFYGFRGEKLLNRCGNV
ncbi:MAG: Transposase [uncultured Sulfurovum sp.]|uniref:Transposase n=1 Tax=uncultured Sulfurovum sp. TaxID=269237 RepID=A0A6S6T6D2_9BACT|nr:MAG: Transposase [uncultured Sulfurovum sp.]